MRQLVEKKQPRIHDIERRAEHVVVLATVSSHHIVPSLLVRVHHRAPPVLAQIAPQHHEEKVKKEEVRDVQRGAPATRDQVEHLGD